MNADAALEAGLRHLDAKRFREAEAVFRQALAGEPKHLALLNNLGSALIGQGKGAEAESVLRRALAVAPDHPVVLRNLSDALRAARDLAGAETILHKAIAAAPGISASHYQLGFFLYEMRRPSEAEAPLRRALELSPASGDAHNMLGNVLLKLGRLDEALAAFNAALRAAPESALFHINAGLCHRHRGDYAAALAAYARAIELRPDYAEAHFASALVHLVLEDFEQGWPAFEWRLRLAQPLGLRDLSLPRWDGSDLGGRSLFVHAEQGYGDTVQFMRCLPLLKQKNPGRVVFCCDPVMLRLLEGSAGYDELVTRRVPPPGMDCHVPLMSLPGIFNTRTATIPASVPYLRADPDAVRGWNDRLGGSGKRRIGIAWAGRPTFANDHSRSMALAGWRPLLEAFPEDLFVSLQMGPAAKEAAQFPSLLDISSLPQDLADAAAIIENLDLVISVDTVLAHIAGAMGKPVWTLLSFDPDWRWFLHRPDTRWYPTMTLLRQPRPGDWLAVIEAARAKLSQTAGLARRPMPQRT